MLYFSSLHFVPYKVLNAKPENVDREGEVVGQVCACVKGTEEEEKRRMGGRIISHPSQMVTTMSPG